MVSNYRPWTDSGISLRAKSGLYHYLSLRFLLPTIVVLAVSALSLKLWSNTHYRLKRRRAQQITNQIKKMQLKPSPKHLPSRLLMLSRPTKRQTRTAQSPKSLPSLFLMLSRPRKHKLRTAWSQKNLRSPFLMLSRPRKLQRLKARSPKHLLSPCLMLLRPRKL